MWLNRHSNIRMGLIVLSILFIIVSLIASDRLINKMAEEERVNMEIWANATQATSTNDISTTLIYLSRILESNPSIPTIRRGASSAIGISTCRRRMQRPISMRSLPPSATAIRPS